MVGPWLIVWWYHNIWALWTWIYISLVEFRRGQPSRWGGGASNSLGQAPKSSPKIPKFFFRNKQLSKFFGIRLSLFVLRICLRLKKISLVPLILLERMGIFSKIRLLSSTEVVGKLNRLENEESLRYLVISLLISSLFSSNSSFSSDCEHQWNFKPRTILKPLFWPKRREYVGPKFESHTLYVVCNFLQKSENLLDRTFYGPELAGPGFGVSLHSIKNSCPGGARRRYYLTLNENMRYLIMPFL